MKKDKDKTFVKFANRKDSLQVLRRIKHKGMNPSVLDLPQSTKIYESLFPYYRGNWKKCKKVRERKLLHNFFTISGIIRVVADENGPFDTNVGPEGIVSCN